MNSKTVPRNLQIYDKYTKNKHCSTVSVNFIP